MSSKQQKARNVFDDCELVLPKWNANISEDVIVTGQQTATNIMMYIALCNNENDVHLLNQKARCFYNALSFLSKNDIDTILLMLIKLLEIKKSTRPKIVLDMPLSSFKIDILNLNDFHSITIMSLNYLPSSAKSLNESTKQCILQIFLLLFDFMKVKNIYAVQVTRAAYMLMKKHFVGIDLCKVEDLVQTVGRSFMAISSNTKAIEYCEKMIEILIKDWCVSKRIFQFKQLNYVCSWDNYDCCIAAYLLNMWPTSESALDLLISFAPRLCQMLTEKNISSSAMMVLGAALPHLELENWNNVFVPLLINLMPDEIDEQKAYVKSTLLECANIVVKRYGGGVYKETKEFDLSMIYTVLLLHCEVQQGFLNLLDLQNDIGMMIYSSNSIVQEYAFKTLCICNNKHVILNKWQLDFIIDYLEIAMFEIDIYCHNELLLLFSHVCITANDIIRTNRNVDILHSEMIVYYVSFIDRIHKFCLNNIASKSCRRVTIGTQIFDLMQHIFKDNSYSLKTKYKLSKEEHYEQQNAPFYEYLKYNNLWLFDNAETLKIFHNEFYSNKKVYPEIPTMLLKWYSKSVSKDLLDIDFIYNMGIALLCSKYDHESIEKGCHCIQIILANEVLSKEYNHALITLISEELLNKSWQMNNCGDLLQSITSSIFGLTKCIPCLLKPTCYLNSDIKNKAFNYCKNVIINILNVIYCDPKIQQFGLQRKVIEYTLVACLDVMSLLVDDVKEPNHNNWFKKSLETCYLVIEKSNMKKTVTTAVSFIHKLSSQSFSNNETIVIKFLEYVLNSIYKAPDYLTSKIRRNPEHRSTIHAIVTADQDHGHTLLSYTLNSLYRILSDQSSASSFIVSTLHTIEILISDNSLKFTMQPFVFPTAVHCIDKFSSKDWPVRNASIQVLQSLVNRILGQKTNILHRRNPIEEVCMLFPQISSYFYSTLLDSNTENVCDSTIAILAIFSESHSKLDITLNKDITVVIKSFLRIFTDLICNSKDITGKFAAKAFVALYPVAYIPFLVCDIVEWIRLNFNNKSKNIFYTFICVLELLYEKFNVYNFVPYYSVGLKIIRLSFQQLLLFLEKLNDRYQYSLFNLLNVKANNIDLIERSLEYQLKTNSYKSRLWINNYVPHMLRNINIRRFPDILKICLDNTCSIHIQIYCLNGILNRYQELVKLSLTDQVLNVVLDKFFSITNQCSYLIISYSHVILLLLENTFCLKDNLLDPIRTDYSVSSHSNIYFVSVFISLLSHFNCYTDDDQIFIKSAIITYKNATMTDDFELHYHVATTLKYLYKCVRLSDRHHVLKMAFVLLMDQEYEISSEICKFVANTFKTELCNVYQTLHILLSYKHLLSELGSAESVCMLLVDLSVLMSSLDDNFIDCEQFYMKQNSDICLHKHYFKNVLLNELKDVFKLLPRKSCIEILCNAQYTIIY